uniref:SD-repeat containing protein B domain-containing protein n=1 Tax=Paramoeba aestuarina TaxID=180227 RepID=A0A7S4JXU6_9EUKA|mmetsp:Transcript_13720/g.21278  ORF Transcript_13720/g.21278 Transcript_13720/m.21278 type:complete len:1289 (+) Transcript_13720:268-4134(+)|eukprot:CAMPEP_0201520362 /NCGR_PEP_ID=MMETSP0161_2-20130828/10658_1 /ASSEMBLY_ACC=CAM_ASM_000251 /TAXON_ID=180227 /ORGANISM="Neoparamoeba aestuarina, Strain SoJaBio B1-5/56/2" /LENGTH=1288 /DNA_ID=CAMNT_0047918685 /DNA_START=216 /DNA_END=4082 /DNA_ORIENTATION=-
MMLGTKVLVLLGLVAVVFGEPLYIFDCDCENGDMNEACIPDGHYLELREFSSLNGFADYTICNNYETTGNNINYFSFFYDPTPSCVPGAQDSDWNVQVCRTQYSYADRENSANDFDNCPISLSNCPRQTSDSSCNIENQNLFKCLTAITTASECVTARVTFPPGMVEGPFGTFIKGGAFCEQGCSLGPSCETCTSPPPPPVFTNADLENECSEFNDGLLPYCVGLDITSSNSDCGDDYFTREAKRNAHYHDAFHTHKSRALRDTAHHQLLEFATEEYQTLDHFNPVYLQGGYQNGLGKKTNIPFNSDGAVRVDCPETATAVRVRLDGLSNAANVWVAGDSGEENGWHGPLKGPYTGAQVKKTGGYLRTVGGAGAVVVVDGPGIKDAFVSGILCSFDLPENTKKVHNIPNKVLGKPPMETFNVNKDKKRGEPELKEFIPPHPPKKAKKARQEEVIHGVAEGFDKAEGFGSKSYDDDFTHGAKRGYTPEADCFCQEGLDDYKCTYHCEGTNDGCTTGMECVRDDMIVFPRRVPEGAAAHITFVKDDSNGNPRNYICSGGLLGQVNNYPPGKTCADEYVDYCPKGFYNNLESNRFLTSGHCLSTQEQAETLELFFNYSISCEQSTTGNCYSGSGGYSELPYLSYNYECAIYSAGADLLVSSEDPQFSYIQGDAIISWAPYGDFTLLALTGDLPPSRCYFGYSTINYATRYGEVVHRCSHPFGSPRAYSDSTAAEASYWEGGLIVFNSANKDGDLISSLHVNLTDIGMSALGPQGGSSGGIIYNDLGQVVGTQSGYSFFWGWVKQPNNGYSFTYIWGDYVDQEFDPCKPNYFSDSFYEYGDWWKSVNQFSVIDGSFYAYFRSVEQELEEICCPPLSHDLPPGTVPTTRLDFNINTDGTPILPPTTAKSGIVGDDVYNRWAAWGISVYTQKPGQGTSWSNAHPPQLFNSSNPCCGDKDLGSPNEEFNGPGEGSGGEHGPGANTRRQGWVMIVSEGNDQNNPDDEAGGGAIVFLFENPVPIAYAEFIDIDFNEVNGYVECTNTDNEVFRLPLIAYGDNCYYRAEFYVSNIVNLTVYFPGSGSIAGITFCDETTPRLNAIGDRVWVDQNGNGIQEAYERVGVPNVKVQLHNPDIGTGTNQRLAQTFTDDDGYYLFDSLPDGDYVVSFDIDDNDSFFDYYKSDPEYNGWSWSPVQQGSNGALDSNAYEESGNEDRAITTTITLAGGVRDMTWDAGIYLDSPNVCIPEDTDTSRRSVHKRARSIPHKPQKSDKTSRGTYTPTKTQKKKVHHKRKTEL